MVNAKKAKKKFSHKHSNIINKYYNQKRAGIFENMKILQNCQTTFSENEKTLETSEGTSPDIDTFFQICTPQ